MENDPVFRYATYGLRLLKLKDREHFQSNYLRPLVEEQLIGLTIPDKPNSRLQKYVITEKGRKWLNDFKTASE